ncbi:MAG: TetR/AcrR family transcriptional regulator, partial [Acidobacteriota bacterium]
MPITLGQHPASDSPPDGQEADESPRRRDPKATRKALLDAAEELFTFQGPSATSLTQVAKKAGVTKSLIHHHFGSKEELWEEVQQRYFSEYFEAQKAMIEAHGLWMRLQEAEVGDERFPQQARGRLGAFDHR